MISVVVGLEQCDGAVVVGVVFLREPFDALPEVIGDFPVGYAAYRGVFPVEGNILKVVQAGENGHLAETAHACQHREADVLVQVLDVDVYGLKQ